MKNSHRGFLLVTVLFVLLIVSILGAVLLSSTMQNIQYVKHEKEILQSEEIARSGLAYYKTYGVPPLMNAKPQKLRLFPQKNWIVEIKQQGNTLILIGTASLLLLTLVLLFTHSQKIFFGEGNASEQQKACRQ